MSASSRTPLDLYLSIAGFVIFYTAFAIVEFWLMTKYARLGPSSLRTGRYHFEKNNDLANYSLKNAEVTKS